MGKWRGVSLKPRIPGGSSNNSRFSSGSFTFLVGLITGALLTDEARKLVLQEFDIPEEKSSKTKSKSSPKTVIPSSLLGNERSIKGSSSTSFLLPELTIATSLPFTTVSQVLAHQQTVTGATINSSVPPFQHTLPTNIYRRISDHYISEYDPFTRNPRWVYEHLTYEHLFGHSTGSGSSSSGDRKESTFKEDTSIPSYIRARLSDYLYSGYDRGHLAPAGNHHHNQLAVNDTFYLSNISPQIGKGFNRHYWSRLEQFIRNLVHNKQYENIYVITGPLYIPKFKYNNESSSSSSSSSNANAYGRWVQEYPLIGTPLHWIHVPTHYYKVILTETADASMAIAAFLVPNQAIPSSKDMKEFLVPLSSVSTLSGLKFFQHKLDNEHIVYVDKLDSYNVSADSNKTDLVQNIERLLVPDSSSIPSHVLASLFNHSSTVTEKETSIGNENTPTSLKDTIFKGYPSPSKTSTAFRTVRHLCAITDCTLPSENWYANISFKVSKEKKTDTDESMENGSSVSSSISPPTFDRIVNEVGAALRLENSSSEEGER